MNIQFKIYYPLCIIFNIRVRISTWRISNIVEGFNLFFVSYKEILKERRFGSDSSLLDNFKYFRKNTTQLQSSPDDTKMEIQEGRRQTIRSFRVQLEIVINNQVVAQTRRVKLDWSSFEAWDEIKATGIADIMSEDSLFHLYYEMLFLSTLCIVNMGIYAVLQKSKLADM